MPVTPEQAQWFADAFEKLVDNIDQAILGKKPGANWFRFRDGSRGYDNNMVVRGDTFTGPKGSVPNC